MTGKKPQDFDIPYPKGKSGRGGARLGAGRPPRQADGLKYTPINCGRWNSDDLDDVISQLTPAQRQAVLILASRRVRLGLPLDHQDGDE